MRHQEIFQRGTLFLVNKKFFPYLHKIFNNGNFFASMAKKEFANFRRFSKNLGAFNTSAEGAKKKEFRVFYREQHMTSSFSNSSGGGGPLSRCQFCSNLVVRLYFLCFRIDTRI